MPQDPESPRYKLCLFPKADIFWSSSFWLHFNSLWCSMWCTNPLLLREKLWTYVIPPYCGLHVQSGVFGKIVPRLLPLISVWSSYPLLWKDYFSQFSVLFLWKLFLCSCVDLVCQWEEVFLGLPSQNTFIMHFSEKSHHGLSFPRNLFVLT